MNNYNEINTIVKGIYYNKKTKLCIFEINQGELKWYNVHIDKIEGKFYQGCSALLYKYDDEILKAVIFEPEDKKRIKKIIIDNFKKSNY